MNNDATAVADPQAMPKSKSKNPNQGKDDAIIAREQWSRYDHMKVRGHSKYCERARRLGEYYFGGSDYEQGQFELDDLEYLEDTLEIKTFEINEIFDAVNTAVGYQINNRLDISFRPRSQGASDEIATTLSKVAMQVADSNRLPWTETQVFLDGFVKRRGFYDIRMSFDESLKGKIKIMSLDPMDVIPDPDAKSYDPDDWNDVVITRWLTMDEIEVMYGSKAAKKIAARLGIVIYENDFGWDGGEPPRNKFGLEGEWNGTQFDAYYQEGGVAHIRVIDRQRWHLVKTKVVVFPTGDVRNAERATPDQLKTWKAQGCIILNRMSRRIRWTVTTKDLVLHDDWSPYDHFTVVPYFPFFDRGITRGAVDNAIGPQDLLNKSVMKITQILATVANSGWMVEQNSLVGSFKIADLRTEGAKNGLVLEYRKGATKPEKIEPNQMPSGYFEVAQMASEKIKRAMGNPDSLKNDRSKSASGAAVQSGQWGDQMSIAMPLDNLSRTRHLVADRILCLIQSFMDEPQIMRITQTNKQNGNKETAEIQLNWQQADGSILNDLTVGEYDVVITEQPAQVTFDNSQYNQAMEMKKEGVAIPDDVIIRYSTLQDKADIIDRMSQQTDPKVEAEQVLNQAKAALATAQALSFKVQGMFSAIRTAQIARADPASAAIADTILASADFEDATQGEDHGEPIPTAPTPGTMNAPPPQPVPPNTDPLTSGNAVRGAEAGIEGGQSGG